MLLVTFEVEAFMFSPKDIQANISLQIIDGKRLCKAYLWVIMVSSWSLLLNIYTSNYFFLVLASFDKETETQKQNTGFKNVSF